jgi:hypothetical protein
MGMRYEYLDFILEAPGAYESATAILLAETSLPVSMRRH